MKSKERRILAVIPAFGMVSLSWGVMFVPYNLCFLLMLSMPAFLGDDHVGKKRL